MFFEYLLAEWIYFAKDMFDIIPNMVYGICRATNT